tara:strand:- start:5253 stop:5813 length:561 start_codon:yes stop_codon:yes gene_type:complete
MLSTHKNQILDLTKTMNTLLLLTGIALLVANIFLTAGIFYAMRQHTVTVVPPTLSEPFTLSNQVVDESYLKQMSEYFLYLKVNVTPESVGRNYSQLLHYVDANSYAKVQPYLMEEAQRVKAQKISSMISISNIEISTETLQVKVSGILKKWVGSRALDEEQVTYLVTMQYNNVLTLLGIQHIKNKK